VIDALERRFLRAIMSILLAIVERRLERRR